MSNHRIEMFFGDGCDSENPQDFIKMLEVSFDNDSALTTAQKCEQFRRHCRSTMDAEEWYDLQDLAMRGDWDKLKMVFNAQWPPRVRIKPSKTERTKELHSTLLAEGDILKKTDKGDIMVYGFTGWIDKVTHLTALCDTANAHVQSVYETTLKILRDLISEGEPTLWSTFGAAVCAVSITKLREGITTEARHKAVEEHLAELDRRQRNPPPAPASSTAMDNICRAFGGMTLNNPTAPRAYSVPLATPAAGGAQRGWWTCSAPPYRTIQILQLGKPRVHSSSLLTSCSTATPNRTKLDPTL